MPSASIQFVLPGASHTKKPTTEQIEVMGVLLSDSVMGGEPDRYFARAICELHRANAICELWAKSCSA